ncbi:MAG: DUF6690 family protein [Pirellulaceae bacterium]
MLRFLFRRTFLLIASLVASVFVPYAWSNDNWKESLAGIYRQWTSRNTAATDGSFWGQPAPTAFVGSGDPSSASHQTAYGAPHGWSPTAPVSLPVGSPSMTAPVLPSVDVREVLRVDITPEWIVQRWPRVTNFPAEKGWTGFRVPLVTGTRIGDIAGSLTYYFDSRGQVQRLSLVGGTGDATALIGLATGTFGLRNEGGPGSGLYVARWNQQPTSVLQLRQAAVIHADSPQSRYEIVMEINRPGFGYGLSPAVQQQLAHRL